MDNDILLVEENDNFAIILFNRPERKNSLTSDLLIKLHLQLESWAKEDRFRTVIFRGVGEEAFSSGYDIMSIPTELTPEMQEWLEGKNPVELALESVKNYPYPTIAMLNGYAFGAGLNLAICCDIRIGANDIKVGMPPAKLGIVYHPEGIRQFINVIGMARTKEIFYTGKTYKNEMVEKMGLVDHLVDQEILERTVYDYAEAITNNAPLSLKGIKKIISMFENGIEFNDENRCKAEVLIAEAFNSDDLKEGQTAFIERRKPAFKGR